MSAEQAQLVRTFDVAGHTVTLTLPRPEYGGLRCMAVEWNPIPTRKLGRKALKQYRRGRDTALLEWAALNGQSKVLVIET